MATDGAEGALAAQSAVERLVQAVKDGNMSELKAASRHLGGAPASISSIRDRMGRGMLHYAAQYGQKNMVEYLVKTCSMDVNQQDEEGETPLALSAATGKAAALKMLLSLGADPSVRKNDISTAPVHRAASATESGGQPPEVLVLLLQDSRVQVDTVSRTGTPLCWAASAGNIGAVNLLLSRGADPNNAGSEEDAMPALSLAVAAHNTPCVEALLAAGAKVNTRGRGGATPLHVGAAVQGANQAAMCQTLETLMKAGADVNAKDKAGFTALEVAVAAENPKAVELLMPVTAPLDGVEPWTVESLTAHVHKTLSAMANDPATGPTRIVIPEAEEPDKEQAAIHKRKGDELFVARDYAGAVDAYSQSLRHDTQSAVVWANRAAALLKLERAQEALGDAQRSRVLDPRYPKAWYREGAAHEMLKDWESAANCYFEGSTVASDKKEFEAAFKRAIEEGRKEFQAKLKAGH